MPKISAPVWFDGNGQFYNGQLFGVDAQAEVIGQVYKPNGHTIPGFAAALTVLCTEVKDPVYGGLFLQLSLDQWEQYIRNATASTAPQLVQFVHTVTADEEGGVTITDSQLDGFTIVQVWRNGVELNPDQVSVTGTTLTFTTSPADVLGEGDEIGITGYQQ